MATSTVTYTHGLSAPTVMYFSDGQVQGVPGSLGYDDSEVWTVAGIEKYLAKEHPGQKVVILSID